MMKVVFAVALAAAVIILSLYIYKESTGYTVTDYELESDVIEKDIKIVYLSDLHNCEYGEDNCELLSSIYEINPDIVIFGGDMITCNFDEKYDFSSTLDFIKALSEKYRIFYGIGNHERKYRDSSEKTHDKYREMDDFLKEINVPLLADSKDTLDEYGIDIYCLDIGKEYYRKVITRHFPDGYIAGKLGKPDKEKYSILIAHHPDHFKQCAEWGADLVLSGHIHGGIVNIPHLGGVVSPAIKFFPKYDGGKFTEGDSTMILSRGIGSHTIHIRVNNKAEIVVINIKKSNKGE